MDAENVQRFPADEEQRWMIKTCLLVLPKGKQRSIGRIDDLSDHSNARLLLL